MCLYAAKQASAQQAEPAAPAVADIKPLEVGDFVPEETWHIPLTFYSAADGSTKTVTLNDHRGKVIVLDFWATWCSPCLFYMPHQFALQKRFGNDVAVLPVTYEKADYVADFIRTSTYERIQPIKSEFHSVTENRSLLKHFPLNTSLPLIVVITSDGKVDAVTTPLLLTEEYVASAIASKERYAPPKRGSIAQVPPLLKYSLTDVKQYKPVYYTSISGEIDGAESIGAVDTLDGAVRVLMANSTILGLYAVGRYGHKQRDFAFAGPGTHNRRILEVGDPSLYDHYQDGNYRTVFDLTWRRENCYTYESVLPAHREQQYKQLIVDDLNRFFGLYGRIEQRKVPVWVIRVSETFKPSARPLEGFRGVNNGWIKTRVKEDQYVGPNSDGYESYVENLNSQYLAGSLMSYFFQPEKGFSSPPIIDETALPPNTPINIGFPNSEELTFEEISEVLASQGILLTKEEREIPMFVLTEPGYEAAPGEKLILTKYGYLPESNFNDLFKN